MISFIILLLLLVAQLTITAYNYDKINTSETFSGSEKADISKNLTLGALVLSVSFFIFISALHFFKFIDYSRSEFLLIVSVLLVSIVILISYHYLYLQYKSPAGYQSAKDNLRDNSVLVNEDELNIALAGGITTLGLVIIIAGILIGKYLIAEKKIIRIKEPVYMNMQTSTMKDDYKEPDYMSEVSKNFIV